MIDVFTFRGTGEPQDPAGRPTMLHDVTKLLEPAKYTCREPIWPATIGPVGGVFGPSLESSVRAAVDAGLTAIRDSPNVAGLIGYSLGAICTSRILEEVEKKTVVNADGSKLQVAFILNLASPVRLPGQSVGNLCGGELYGLHGKHGRWPAEVVVMEYANPKDIITSASDKSPLRTVDPAVSKFSLIEGGRAGEVILALVQKLGEAAGDPPKLKAIHEALTGIAGYLTPWPYGEHVLYSGQKVKLDGKDKLWTTHAADYLNANYPF